MSKLDWNKEFVKYIRRLQNTPKYKGFTYPCLVSVESIKKDFQERKKKYLSMVKRSGGRRNKTKRRNKHRGGRSTESEGLPPAPNPLPFVQRQLLGPNLFT